MCGETMGERRGVGREGIGVVGKIYVRRRPQERDLLDHIQVDATRERRDSVWRPRLRGEKRYISRKGRVIRSGVQK